MPDQEGAKDLFETTFLAGRATRAQSGLRGVGLLPGLQNGEDIRGDDAPFLGQVFCAVCTGDAARGA